MCCVVVSTFDIVAIALELDFVDVDGIADFLLRFGSFGSFGSFGELRQNKRFLLLLHPAECPAELS